MRLGLSLYQVVHGVHRNHVSRHIAAIADRADPVHVFFCKYVVLAKRADIEHGGVKICPLRAVAAEQGINKELGKIAVALARREQGERGALFPADKPRPDAVYDEINRLLLD